MELNTDELNLQVHNLPAVVLLECTVPPKVVDNLNTYLDEYRETAEVFKGSGTSRSNPR